MRSFIKKFRPFVVIAVLLSSCLIKKKEVVHGPREALDIQFIQSDHFRYRYYKLSLSDSLNATRSVFFTGTYEKLSDKRFKLIPDRFDSDSVQVQNLIATPSQRTGISHVQINTTIREDPDAPYMMVLHVGTDLYHFNKSKIDTMIRSTTGRRLSVEIYLPEFYKKARPLVKYQKIGTKGLIMPADRDISFTIPITFDHFYYENTPPFILQDGGRYWFKENERIRITKGI